MIWTVTFNPAVDYTLPAEHIVVGEVNRAGAGSFRWGGKGINVSIMLHRLGCETVATGFIAGFTGKALEEGVRAMGVNTDLVLLPEGYTRVNVKVRAHRETDLNAEGPNIPPASAEELLNKLKKAGPGDIVCVSGSVPEGISPDYLRRMFEQIRACGADLAADLTGDALRAALDYRPLLVKPNHLELADFFGGVGSLTENARTLRSMGAQNVLISRGENGALLIDETDVVRTVGVPEGTPVDSVGAGDSMVAGFLAGWDETRDPAYALRLAAAAGSATAYSPDLAEGETVWRLLQEL